MREESLRESDARGEAADPGATSGRTHQGGGTRPRAGDARTGGSRPGGRPPGGSPPGGSAAGGSAAADARLSAAAPRSGARSGPRKDARKDARPNWLFARYSGNPIITAADLPYRANTVFNPAAAEVEGSTVLLMRVEDMRGISHLAAARSRDGATDWSFDDRPTFASEPENHPEEIWGVEDPRLTWLPETQEWAVAYTAYSRRGPLVSLAFTRDFQTFNRLGPVMPPEDKDAALFPRRFGGRWALIHRPSPLRGPSHMWVSYSPDLRHWGDHSLLLPAREGAWWDAGKIGLGPPPLETAQGWLVMYHGVHQTASGSLYRLGFALLDLEDPRIILRRSDEWVFGPSEQYERTGDVVGVTFPCGWILDAGKDEIRMYYGAADSSICLATARLSEILDYVKSCPVPDRRRLADRP